jgi:hypothetical protein
MKKVINVIIMCALVFLLRNVALGQKRSAKGATKQTISSACKGQAIPKGLVIVGYKSSAKCGDNSGLILKKPADAEIICDTSPVPQGYHVISQQGSAACVTADSNPLTNALSIARDGADASSGQLSRPPYRITMVALSFNSAVSETKRRPSFNNAPTKRMRMPVGMSRSMKRSENIESLLG